MKKQMKILIKLIFFIIILSFGIIWFGENQTSKVIQAGKMVQVATSEKTSSVLDGKIEFSQDYLDYLQLSDEERENVLAPRTYDIPQTKKAVTNPFKLTRLIGSSLQSNYSLRDIIPENIVIKNQLLTDTCWTFASLSMLETHLALQDYKNKINPVIYDFSEQHMDYATTKVFADGEINEYGFNRTAGEGATPGMPLAYLTNGLGAVAEEDMPFEGGTDLINKEEVYNKEVITQVKDLITFPTYLATDDKTEIITQMKEHIMNYGAIDVNINYIANSVGAVYVSSENSSKYPINHAVAIIGWNDNYEVENFTEGSRPENAGAWIAKNSYGSEFGDEGFIYISYEDVNVYQYMTGITNGQTELDYENIYQYDEQGGYLVYKLTGISKFYLATEFDKKTTGKEYLTQIAINAAESYTCRVFVNPNGTSKALDDLQLVELKFGETETFEAGYHTIEFKSPIKVGDNFVVVLELEGTQTDTVSTLIEVNFGEFYTDEKYNSAVEHMYDTVTISDSKCFLGAEYELLNNEWVDVSKMYEISNGNLPNFDTTIKAFTTSKVLENIEVTKQPTKTEYLEGENFDSTGMVVTGNWANGDKIEITDYEIKNGENLTSNQTSITISYNGLTTTQAIKVEPKVIDKPENSNFDNIELIINKLKVYSFTDTNKRTYGIIDVEIANIANSTKNEKTEYYYYLSPNINEENITDWISIGENDASKLKFEINTLDVTNSEEIADAERVYLYIKEIATKNSIKTEKAIFVGALELDNTKIEEYVDGEKKAETTSETIVDSTPGEIDDTLASGTIPNAGKSMLTLFCIIAFITVSRIVYLKYKNIEIK